MACISILHIEYYNFYSYMKSCRLCLFLDVGMKEYKFDFVQGFNYIKNPLFRLSVSSRISIYGGVC